MWYRSSIAAFALAAALNATMGGAQAADDAKYPDWSGQWTVILTRGLAGQGVKFDPTKPWGPGQQAPLTALVNLNAGSRVQPLPVEFGGSG